MQVAKRISGPQKIVASCDPALANLPLLKTRMIEEKEVPHLGTTPYNATLDMGYLGDFSDPKMYPTGPPMVFEVMPLPARLMNWDRGTDTDWFEVFRHNVIGVENCKFSSELEREPINGLDYKIFTDKSVEMFMASYIKDIAHKVVELSKGDGVSVPFSTLGGSTASLKRSQVAQRMNLASAHMVDAKAKN